MMTEQDIKAMITIAKKIIQKTPVKGYKEEDGNKRCQLTLVGGGGNKFSVFIRQNTTFIENFSIGLRYKTRNRELGNITLVRYNGPHGEASRHQDDHYNKPHIHRITEAEL